MADKKKSSPPSKGEEKQTSLAKISQNDVGNALVPIIEVKPGLVRAEALQVYLQSLKNYPLLSPEKELQIAQEFQKTKDPRLAQLLVLSNLRLVVKIAYDYSRTGIHILDLIQEGNVGLLQAVKEYDPHKGVKLSSYASYWIKAYIRSFILKNWSLVKMGTTRAQRALFYRLNKEKNKLEMQGISPEPKYLAEKLEVREKDVVEMTQRLSGKDISLDQPLYHDDPQGDSLLQSLKDSAQPADDRIADQEVSSEFHDRLNTFERTLAGKELIVFRERLRSEEPKTLQEIGDTYGITRERIRQIEARVMEKLKIYMQEHAAFLKKPVVDISKKSD